MRLVEPPTDRSIMVIAAHPDDMESWCSGTIARSIRAGSSVRLLLLTSGDKGSNDPATMPEAVATVREQEARRSADLLGIEIVEFLRLPDGEVEDTPELRCELAWWIRQWQPGVVFTHDPEHAHPPYFSHRDHRVAGRVALDAIYPFARDQLACLHHRASRLRPHQVSHVWLFASEVADSFVDISETMGVKIEARLAHESQTENAEQLRTAWLRRAREIGEPAGTAFAEAFTIVAAR